MGLLDLLTPSYWENKRLDNRLLKLRKENGLLKKKVEIKNLEAENQKMRDELSSGTPTSQS